MNQQHYATNRMSDVVATANLNTAFAFVYNKRIKDSPNSDIWDLSLKWEQTRALIQKSLLSGNYQLAPVKTYRTETGNVTRWNSLDAVVLKAVSLILQPRIAAFAPDASHLKGCGGLKSAVRKIRDNLRRYRYVIRSDVACFYDSMQVANVRQVCGKLIKDTRVLDIIQQTIERVEITDGEHQLKHKGLPKGCPLSPLVGALMLKSLGNELPKDACFALYMDDWVMLTNSRHGLKRWVKRMHGLMKVWGFRLAKAKTFIGRIAKRFDFLGYRFNATGLCGLAQKTINNFKERRARLFEQGATKERIGQYELRWFRWVIAEL